jgi:hypothetical protein
MITAIPAAQIDASARRKAPSKLARSKRQRRQSPELLTLASLDGRTKASRRAYELIQQFTDNLGSEPTAIQQQIMLHAATLGIIIENLEVRALEGEIIDPAEFATLLNAQRRTLASL